MDITRRDIQLPAKTHYEPRILSIRQQRTLLRGFYGHLLEAWLICAVSCGLRTEEGYGLEWGDIDLRSGVLHVERDLQGVVEVLDNQGYDVILLMSTANISSMTARNTIYPTPHGM